ncbi:MAG TPA: phosphoribosylamine--glycine ligase [Candidatus Nitrosopelagicus sp.]|nr:MAG: phosphoribosylamine--glycine ligase [Nitrososphaerota archaeon]HIO32654.1 phosphoribosylamine--glycine ligase [Candidatus Nitrosopelagicus sp.]
MVNVLVIGSGGREHAIGWKLGQSDEVDTVFFAPGNGGTSNNVPIPVDGLDDIVKFASEKDCFTVVGPEAPLAMGIVDIFNEKGLKIFGPTKDAAQLESSKIWAKKFMKRNNIPTAAFEVFNDATAAKEYVNETEHNVVVKADGLAAGKGVIVCNNKDEAKDAIDMMLVNKKFGDAGTNIIIEDRIDGVEASYIALSDGKKVIPMATSQDHKRVYDGDNGPNTGGMGAYSPTLAIDEVLSQKIQEKIIDKTITSLRNEGITFKGFLYAGIMLKDGEPYVLEYNVRMGDPECQPILMRMNSDLFQYLKACVNDTLEKMPPISWKNKSAVCVVLASKGYPESYPKGDEISGLDLMYDDAYVFHAGTKKQNKKIIANGGRVLGVTALGDTLESAIKSAYSVAEKIFWENKYSRTDIGKKGLTYL